MKRQREPYGQVPVLVYVLQICKHKRAAVPWENVAPQNILGLRWYSVTSMREEGRR